MTVTDRRAWAIGLVLLTAIALVVIVFGVLPDQQASGLGVPPPSPEVVNEIDLPFFP